MQDSNDILKATPIFSWSSNTEGRVFTLSDTGGENQRFTRAFFRAVSRAVWGAVSGTVVGAILGALSASRKTHIFNVVRQLS